MRPPRRRDILKTIGTATTATALTGRVGARQSPPDNAKPRARGRIDKIGHLFPEGDLPRYTYAHVRADGMFGVVGSFPRGGNLFGSTLYDLSDLANPVEAHRLESVNPFTRTNHVRFDGTRDGLYYRTWEADTEAGLEGVEVVDYGWGSGTPENPVVVGSVETPNTGVHTISAHPEEEVIYAVDDADDIPAIIPIDVSDPTDPEFVGLFGPPGDCHATEVDAGRDVLHCAYIGGDFEGYATLDISDPLDPTVIGQFDYTAEPDNTSLDAVGFSNCHHAHFDPERELAYVGDEECGGVPGGKHVFDIGWDEGSLADPKPIGFTRAPDAREQGADNVDCFCFWTGHFHDVTHVGDEVLLVDGGYRQGTWIANVTDPTNPVPTERYATDDVDDIDAVEDHYPFTPPYNWSTVYNEERDFFLSHDTLTGVYTFEVTDKPARGRNGGGPPTNYDLDEIRSRRCE